MGFFRDRFIALLSMSIALAATSLSSPVLSEETAPPRQQAIQYLESLKGTPERYIAPSEIDPRYTIALYVNASTRGLNRQRMWVLQREEIGGEWRMGLWDKRYWKRKSRRKKYGLAEGEAPPFSWLVSTGRYYRGDRFAGPTPSGVYSLDERRGRSRRGWHARGMKHTLFIDYHYSSGRQSGIAFHGTTYSMYRRLGRADSHGCIRMRQENALALLKRVRGWDKVFPKEMYYGQVPRYWKRERGRKRFGYRRDGKPHYSDIPKPEKLAENFSVPIAAGIAGNSQPGTMIDAPPEPKILTKNGFRAVAIIFRD